MGTFSLNELQEEIEKRDVVKNPFPLEVFNDAIKPFINALNKQYDIPSSFIGLSLLSAYSTGIGTAYTVSTNGRDKIYLPVWAALVGLSSSGKTIAINNVYSPLDRIQKDFSYEWKQKIKGKNDDHIKNEILRVVIYRDAHIPTLVAWVLKDNPKGVLKMSDELLEWINGMNQLSRKESIDEQFWISSWNCSTYSAIRSGKKTTDIPRPFVNVIGGAQYSVLEKLFARDRDTTGFVFRLLFALPDIDKIADPDPTFEMPMEWMAIHTQSLERLYNDLPVLEPEEEPKQCILYPDAIKLYQLWSRQKIKQINAIEDLKERDIHSGILGKIKEYTLRFAAILHIADRALDSAYASDFNTPFRMQEYITANVMERALKLSDYFYKSASDVYGMVQEKITAPPQVLIAAQLLKKGKSFSEIAEIIYDRNGYKMKASRDIKRWIKDYPRVFGSLAK